MTALDLLIVVDVFITVATTAPLWGPALAVLLAAATWWRLRPTGRHRSGRPPLRTTVRTAVREVVRHVADTGPDPAANDALICAETRPDVSAEHCPAVSGHDEEGER
ncbi:hypothetical protein [Streptomyces sp. NPDC086835]|uniref:hypothetical protein n=1 Tax=Streptomyces sp. NPDC086835 TaxID=3365761 RepID=UPI00382201C1